MQEMSLCNSNGIVFVIRLIVHILSNQLLLESSVYAFTDIENVHMEVLCLKYFFDKLVAILTWPTLLLIND